MAKLKVNGFNEITVKTALILTDSYTNEEPTTFSDGVYDLEYYSPPKTGVIIEGAIESIYTEFSAANPTGEQVFVDSGHGYWYAKIDLDTAATWIIDIEGAASSVPVFEFIVEAGISFSATIGNYSLGVFTPLAPEGVLTIDKSLLGDDSVLKVVAEGGYVVESYNPLYTPTDPAGLHSPVDYNIVDGVGYFKPPLDLEYCAFGLVYEVDTSSDVVPFNNIFLLDNEKLTEFSNYNPRGTEENPYNGIDYIINLITIPLNVDSEYVSNAEVEIVLGNGAYSNTGVYAPQITKEQIPFNFGKVVVPYERDSLTEYSVIRKLKSPFLDVDATIPNGFFNKWLSVNVLVDVYTGKVNFNITSDTGNEMYVTASIGRSIPIIPIHSDNAVMGNLGGLVNDLRCLVLEETRNVLVDGEFTPLVEIEGDLTGVVGYVEVVEHNIKGIVNRNELDSLFNILKQGVIINE